MSEKQGHGETIAERRKYPRFPLKLNVQYQLSGQADRRSIFSNSISRDLGIGGVAMMVWEQLDTGQMLDIEIGIPEFEQADKWNKQDEAVPVKKTVLLTSRVVWRWPRTGKRYLIGIQFLDLKQEDALAIKDFLQNYELQDFCVEPQD